MSGQKYEILIPSLAEKGTVYPCAQCDRREIICPSIYSQLRQTYEENGIKTIESSMQVSLRFPEIGSGLRRMVAYEAVLSNSIIPTIIPMEESKPPMVLANNRFLEDLDVSPGDRVDVIPRVRWRV